MKKEKSSTTNEFKKANEFRGCKNRNTPARIKPTRETKALTKRNLLKIKSVKIITSKVPTRISSGINNVKLLCKFETKFPNSIITHSP